MTRNLTPTDLRACCDPASLPFADSRDIPDDPGALARTQPRAMADIVDGWLGQGEPVFVVVGAGHLVGPDGLVALLRAKGYDVTQVGASPQAKGGS